MKTSFRPQRLAHDKEIKDDSEKGDIKREGRERKVGSCFMRHFSPLAAAFSAAADSHSRPAAAGLCSCSLRLSRSCHHSWWNEPRIAGRRRICPSPKAPSVVVLALAKCVRCRHNSHGKHILYPLLHQDVICLMFCLAQVRARINLL